ncbi:MAG: AAA family ATPase [bacterium]|nr:AAA family ATPase [bacterium]
MEHLQDKDGPISVPPNLFKAIESGDCVLFAGMGLGAQAGYPTWSELVSNAVNWCLREGVLGKDFAHKSNQDIFQLEPNLAADLLTAELKQANVLSSILSFLREQYSMPQKTDGSLFREIHEIGFAAIVTTSFDRSLEPILSPLSPPVFTSNDTEQLIGRLNRREPFLLKLFGRLELPDTITFSPAELRDQMDRRIEFRQFISSLFLTRTVLFMGSSLGGIRFYLENARLGEISKSKRHYALVNIDAQFREAEVGLLSRRYGIDVLPFDGSPDFSLLRQFVHGLHENQAASRDDSRVRSVFASSSETEVGHGAVLESIHLQNVGAFEEMEVRFHKRWTVLLGDNGVGKSTILRGIASALCGEDAATYADRLIRTGKDQSRITLKFQNSGTYSYAFEISRKSVGVNVLSLPGRPLDTAGTLILGFPPLRTVSWKMPTGTFWDESSSRPLVTDLLPLVTNEPDPRIDKLKQWILTVEYQSKSASDGPRYQRLLNDLFDVIGRLTGDVKIEFGGIDLENRRILVRTEDGLVAFEQVSQGATSLLGWVGVLLQRLYEMYRQSPNPRSESAIVLIDEIDAHMHPAWQQSIVEKLTECFPNTQFICSTHSPLVVGGMDISQIIKFSRDKATGMVYQESLDSQLTMGGTDLQLTSRLFGLRTALDSGETRRHYTEYQLLLQKGESISDSKSKESSNWSEFWSFDSGPLSRLQCRVQLRGWFRPC